MKTQLRKRSQLIQKLPSKTQQNRAQECDVNVILKKYQQTGMISHLNQSQGHYGDFSNVSDFKTSIDTVKQAQEAFYQLPAQLRKRFGNDPQQLLDFVADNSNYEEAQKLGLVPQQEAPQITQKTPEKQSQTPASSTDV